MLFIRFKIEPKHRYKALGKAYEYLRELQDPQVEFSQKALWKLVPDERRGYFTWDAGQLGLKKALHEVIHIPYYEEKWDTEGNIKLLCNGNYAFDSLVELQEPDDEAEWRLQAMDEDEALEPLIGLIDSFGLEVMGYDDGGGFIELSFSS